MPKKAASESILGSVRQFAADLKAKRYSCPLCTLMEDGTLREFQQAFDEGISPSVIRKFLLKGEFISEISLYAVNRHFKDKHYAGNHHSK